MDTQSRRVSRARRLQHYQSLTETNHEVTSPESRLYNCIAWSVELDDRRMWPGQRGYAWPADLPKDDNLDSFLALYEGMGYQQCADGGLEPGFEKVAIYLYEGNPQHVARQRSDGQWESKLGLEWEDIVHDTAEAMNGTLYGSAAVFLRRTSGG